MKLQQFLTFILIFLNLILSYLIYILYHQNIILNNKLNDLVLLNNSYNIQLVKLHKIIEDNAVADENIKINYFFKIMENINNFLYNHPEIVVLTLISIGACWFLGGGDNSTGAVITLQKDLTKNLTTINSNISNISDNLIKSNQNLISTETAVTDNIEKVSSNLINFQTLVLKKFTECLNVLSNIDQNITLKLINPSKAETIASAALQAGGDLSTFL